MQTIEVAPENTAAIRPIRASTGQFLPGNPGKPKGSRHKLTEDFLRTLSEDFAQHGPDAIVRTRTEEPATYVRVIAALMPRQLEVRRPLEEMSEDELVAAIDAVRRLVASQDATGGIEDARIVEPAGEIQPVPKAG